MIVVRFAHAPKRAHTPNVQTLNFNFCLHASVQTMSFAKVSENQSVVTH